MCGEREQKRCRSAGQVDVTSLTLEAVGAHRVVHASDALLAHLRLTRSELLGQSAADIVDAATLALIDLSDRDVQFSGVQVRLLGGDAPLQALSARMARTSADGFGSIEFQFDSIEGVAAADSTNSAVDLSDAEFTVADGAIRHATVAAARLLHAAGQHELLGEPVARFLRDDDRRRVALMTDRFPANPTLTVELDLDLRSFAGVERTVRARLTSTSWQDQPAVRVELSAHREEAAERRRRDIEDSLSEAIIGTDAHFIVETWNRSAERLYGWTAAEAVGRSVPELIGGGPSNLDGAAAAEELFRTSEWSGTAVQRHRDGTPIYVRAYTRLLRDAYGSVIGVISVNSPEAKPGSSTDALTGAAARGVLFDLLSHGAAGEQSVVVLLDLDSFSSVNSRFGVQVGDAILIIFADRLRASMRPGDLLARVGADRFAVWGPIADEADAGKLTEALAVVTDEQFDIAGQSLAITASIGAAFGDALDGVQLFDRAERALRDATASGGRSVRFFDPTAVPGPWQDDRGFVDDVHRALAAGEFNVVYQPIVDMRDGMMLKVEALARWRHHELGDISPVDFIPIAERTGAIGAIGEWVLRTACADVVEHLPPRVELAVNVSAVQLHDAAFPEAVLAILRETGLPERRLWVEVTESVLVDAMALTPLQQLHEAGARLVIDDFGTGYSSLQYISRLPVEAIKVDRSFVSGLGVDARDTAIVRSVVNLGEELGVEVIAEGVETRAQAEHLLDLHCHRAQGWLYSKAEPIAAVALRSETAAFEASTAPQIDLESIRLEALAATEIMDTTSEAAFDSLTRLAAQLLGSPMALVSLVDRDRQWFKSRVGFDATEIARNIAFCAHAIAQPDSVFIVPDAAEDSRFADNPLVTGPPYIRFYAGAPIRSRENLGLGTLCILDTRPRNFSAGDAQVLRSLADQASALMDLRRRSVELTAQLRSALPPEFAESASRESAAINHGADVLAVIDRSGTIVYANDALRAVLGLDPLYWVGRNALEVIHPQDVELAARLLADSGSISGAHRPFTLRVRRANSSWCSMEFVSNTLTGVPSISGIVLNGRDVSGRAESRETVAGQRRFIELALDNVSEGVIACDASGVLTEFNLAARRLHGQAGRALPAEEWANTYNLRTANGKRQLRLSEVPLYRALLGEHVVDAEMQIAPPGETPRVVRCTGQPLRNDQNVIVGAVVALREVVTTGR